MLKLLSCECEDYSLTPSKYRKIPNISSSLYQPLQTRNAKNPPLHHPSSLGGLYLEIALKYKVKQSKNSKISFQL